MPNDGTRKIKLSKSAKRETEESGAPAKYIERTNKMTFPTDIRHVRIAWESALLAGICALDLGTTIFLIAKGFAKEANPILEFYLDRGGTVSFAGVKLLLFLGPLFLLELIREQRPQFVRGLLRLAIVAYLAIYVIGCMAINRYSFAFAGPGILQSAFRSH